MSAKFTDRFREELPCLWRFAMRLSGDRHVSEELVQKTILRALEKRHQFSECTNLRSCIFTIFNSIWKNVLRSQAIRQKVSFSSVDLDEISVNNTSADDNVFFWQVIKQVNKLPEAQRTVVILVCVEGYSYKEAGDILDIPAGTVMSRLARARLKIGSTFSENEKKSALNSLEVTNRLGIEK
jgi:RNA polymerase sigma-70 factor (ECF subfamily)